MLKLSTDFMYGENPRGGLISWSAVSRSAGKVESAIQAVEARLAQGSYGFIEALNRSELLEQTRRVREQTAWARTMVVVGIGGSNLGAGTIQQAVAGAHGRQRLMLHGDTPDPEALRYLLSRIDISQTVFNIVSKSGETMEPFSQYILLKQKVKELTSDWQKHFIFTTDPSNGTLRREADTHSIATLPIPSDVGGRFSVLTPVGLLPAAAMDVEIHELVRGGWEFAQSAAAREHAQKLARAYFELYTQGVKVAVVMPYSSRLEEFGRWFAQLWSESLGKNNMGIMGVQARGPADQHSQLQFFNQGELLQSVLFITVEQPSVDYTIPETDIGAGRYLAGHSLHKILNVEQRATAMSMHNHGRPSAQLSVSHLTPFALGQLFMFFQLTVVYLAEMLEVNAFDQPGVEESKQLIYALLGKTGYEREH